MKISLILFVLCFLTNPGFCQDNKVDYGVASTLWNQDLGNHRAEISIDKASDAVYVSIPWRRRDINAQEKRIIITDMQGNEMSNIFRININRWSGEFVFQPASGAGKYFVYYMPFKEENSNSGIYNGSYLKREDAPDKTWVIKNQLSVPFTFHEGIGKAKLVRIESRTAYDSFYPMEVCATQEEIDNLVNSQAGNYLLFPEDRKFPIRMTNDLPYKWIEEKPSVRFEGTALRNEYYAFQVGVFAAKNKLEDIAVSYSKFADRLTCFNLGGIDPEGKPFSIKVDVPKGKVQTLWFGFDVPEDFEPGEYTFEITIKPKNDKPQAVVVKIKVLDKVLADRGDSEPWRHSRLRWLNSTLGINDEVVAPYTPLKVSGKKIDCFLRNIQLNDGGFISEIVSNNQQVLARPLQFVVETDKGIEIFQSTSLVFTRQNAGVVSWSVQSASKRVSLSCEGTMEFDGHISYSVKIKAVKKLKVNDIRLEIPFRKEMAQYFMGMGLSGCACPESYDWKWSGPQDSYWLGNVDAGIHCELRGASYSGPMLNLYHPEPPASWNNDKSGGFSIKTLADEVLATTYSGKRELNAGEELTFEFALLITPVKKVNTTDQFVNRYYHNGGDPWPTIDAINAGIKVVNVHHANTINPYINYPFIAVDSMRNFVSKLHNKGLKVKIYYTIRELTNHVAEIWALRSLGNEVLGGGNGGGYPWLQEHFIDNYTVQWYTPIPGYEACEAAVLMSGESRWYNYYVEGLQWLVKNLDIDGLYLDDVSFDRNLLKRMRRVMDGVKPGCIIDLHSNTGFSIGPATQYTEFFPYINKLWFGESFQYDKMSPENWLVETSGIPFGLMGDMLQGGGNPWRGMIYGMTSRLPWGTESVVCNPKEVWKIWDSFGIADSKMIAYWDPACPVKTDNPKVLATAYVKNNKVLISVASWNPTTCDVKLEINWQSLGINPLKAKITAPEIMHFQPGRKFGINDMITVEPAKGWLLIVE